MTDIDYDTLKEIAILKREEREKENSLEIEKDAFQKKLLNGLGDEMLDSLEHPKKPSFWVGLRYKYARWKTIRDGNKEAKKRMKQKKNGGL